MGQLSAIPANIYILHRIRPARPPAETDANWEHEIKSDFTTQYFIKYLGLWGKLNIMSAIFFCEAQAKGNVQGRQGSKKVLKLWLDKLLQSDQSDREMKAGKYWYIWIKYWTKTVKGNIINYILFQVLYT